MPLAYYCLSHSAGDVRRKSESGIPWAPTNSFFVTGNSLENVSIPGKVTFLRPLLRIKSVRHKVYEAGQTESLGIYQVAVEHDPDRAARVVGASQAANKESILLIFSVEN